MAKNAKKDRQAMTPEERAAAHRESVRKSYKKNPNNKEKARIRMAEKRRRLKKLTSPQPASKNITNQCPPLAAEGFDEDGGDSMSDLDAAIHDTRFSSPAMGSVSGEEIEFPEFHPTQLERTTRISESSPVPGSVFGEECEGNSMRDMERAPMQRMIGDSESETQENSTTTQFLPGLHYVELPGQSVLEQISYDLDEEITIAEDLLGRNGFQKMVENNTRELEKIRSTGGRLPRSGRKA